MLLISHPTGNEFVRALLRGCETNHWDYRFFTTIAFNKNGILSHLLPKKVSAALSRRSFAVPANRINSRPIRESVRLAAQLLGFNKLLTHEAGCACVDAVYRDLDIFISRHISRIRPKGIYAYEDGAAASFTVAQQEGTPCIYELPIAYWESSRQLLKEEAERWPEWKATLGSTQDSAAKLERKSCELKLATKVICPSNFVLESIPVKHRQKAQVIPFGSPFIPSGPPRIENHRIPLRVIFAGSMTQRKGLADVFAALKLLNRSDIQLVILGSPVLPLEFYRKQFSDFEYFPPRPHAQVLDLMQSCDLLVLPSIVEGRALVQQEAMTCGLPLLITPNAGGADLILEGQTGFLVPIRSPEKLAEKLAWFADHRSEITGMREASRAKALKYSWENYAEQILDTVKGLF